MLCYAPPAASQHSNGSVTLTVSSKLASNKENEMNLSHQLIPSTTPPLSPPTTMHFTTNPISPALLFLLTLFFSLSAAANPPPPNLVLPSDAVALLTFKSKADTDNKLHYTLTDRFDYCQWPGVKCVQGRVVRFVLQSSDLRGTFPTNSLSRLDQLRVLILRNNSLTGPIPDLSGLVNLKTLFLNNNYFSGFFPPSLLSLHRIRTLDLSRNSLSGPIPSELTVLDRLNYLRLDWNRFNGTIPQLNQTSLEIFNVSHNNLTGPIQVNPTLSKFPNSSFSNNPNLCGEILNKICRSPFFDSPSGGNSAPAPLLQNAPSQDMLLSPPSPKKHNRRVGVILGLIVGFLVLIALILSTFTFYKRRNDRVRSKSPPSSPAINSVAENTTNAMQMQIVNTEVETTTKEKKLQVPQKSGNLIFADGETAMYNLEQLMRASAELLGRGTVGTTYKAVMDNQLIVTVKRLDAGKTAITSGDAFERHMEAVGGLRHPNLVPVRAYFQAKTELLVIYDYQTNGSLYNLIHGSRSTRAKPLHWTSCLKIAEDVALGLAYIHQASKLIHGNLKSSNVLLGPEFEACVTDYCLSVLADSSYSNDDPDSAGYKAPEIRKSGHRSTSKSDVYAFGVLLLELLSGKPPSQHPFLVPTDMSDWVKAMRDDEVVEENRLRMLIEVAGICSLTSPEQRPGMRHVLKMIQEIKETAMLEDNATEAYTGYS